MTLPIYIYCLDTKKQRLKVQVDTSLRGRQIAPPSTCGFVTFPQVSALLEISA